MRIKTQSKNLFIVAVYTNNQEKRKFIDELNFLCSKLNLTDSNNYYIIAGDFNARHTAWGDDKFNRKGTLLFNWTLNEGLSLRSHLLPPLSSTFPSSNSYLDLCLIDNRLSITDLINSKIRTLDYSSDHRALVFTLDVTAVSTLFLTNPSDMHRFMFKKTKWRKFTKKLNSNYTNTIPNDVNLSPTEINNNLTEIEKIISKTIDEIVPKYKPTDNVLNYVNQKIKNLHKYKAFLVTLINKHYKTNSQVCSFNLPFLKSLINRINVELKNEYKCSYTKYCDTQVSSIDPSISHSFFPKINRFFRPREQLKIDSLSIDTNNADLLHHGACDPTNYQTINNKLVIDNPIDILNIIGSHYEKVNSLKHYNANTGTKETVDKKIEQLINTYKNNDAPITTFSKLNPADKPEAVNSSIMFINTPHTAKLFKCLPNKCSSGLDNIPPIVLKHLPPNVTTALTILFNNCLNIRYFSERWKRAKILPILKEAKPPDDPASYRPISLTPAISKVFEMIINQHITTHIKSNNLIPHNQFGFTHKLSTTHAIHKILNDIYSHLLEGESVGACLVDLQCAFDSVWINGLLYILNELNFPPDLIRLIWNMTTDRTFVTWNGDNVSSQIFNIIECLMQGTVNSPSLFNIYTYKVPSLFNANRNIKIYSSAFADDFIILVADKHPSNIQSKLENLVNKISEFYLNWNLKINPSKCETILFHKPLNTLGNNIRTEINRFSISIKINNIEYSIAHKKEARYLGVILDYLLNV